MQFVGLFSTAYLATKFAAEFIASEKHLSNTSILNSITTIHTKNNSNRNNIIIINNGNSNSSNNKQQK